MSPREDIHSANTIRNISEPAWDFRSGGSKLGFVHVQNPMNQKSDCTFLSRIPIRSSRQGLDNKTIQILSYDRNDFDYNWNNVIYDNDGLIRTIKNDFVSPKVAFRRLYDHPETYKSIPIHRKLALFYDNVSPPYLLYRLEKVGYTEDGETFKLAKHKGYLKEELVDMIGLKIA